MRRQISTVSLCLIISPVLLKVLLHELETGNDQYPGRFNFFLNAENTTFVKFTASVGLKNKCSKCCCKFRLKRVNRTIATKFLFSLMLTFLSPTDSRKNFANRNKIYLISVPQTSSESVNVEDEVLILTFFTVFIVVKRKYIHIRLVYTVSLREYAVSMPYM